MFPSLPFGPLSLPTGPVVTLIAVMLGLETAGRYGRRLGLAADDVWNTGMLALLAGLIVARLWNVIQFLDIYLAEPGLLLSLRPSGFVLLPGAVAAMIIAYAYLLRKALDPVRIAAAFAMGALAAGILLNIGAFLTGSTVGMPGNAPWALPYFGELRYPVALYQAAGVATLLAILWVTQDGHRPGRTLLLVALGYSLVRLFTDGFVDRVPLIGEFRASQIVALIAALGVTLLLARGEKSKPATITDSPPSAPPEATLG